MLKEGDILKDRYKVQQLIGRGGMSSVYMGLDLKLTNKLWAIKEVSKNATDQAGRPIEQSLAMEAELLSKLDHPMIVDIVDIVTTEDSIYVVMDYVEGKSLDKVIREEGPQKESDVQDWALQICDALDYLHNQDPPIIYRDMKPSNIMLRPDGYIKLIDLGVAREYKDASKKDTISFGTEGYAPPEQYGKAQTDARSDIYALGATIWHLLSGETPSEYPLPDVRTHNDEVGEGFAKVIIPKCTMLDRDLRYQNCDELVADLDVYEELTQEYFDEQRKKVRTFGATVIGSVIMFVLSLTLFFVGNIVVTQNYNSQLEKGKNSMSRENEACENAFIEAINYKPGEKEPYERLITYYETMTGKGTEEVPVFTTDKYNKIHELLEKYERSLKDSGQFADLYYWIGKELWDNYDDGSVNSDIIAREPAMNKSKPLFENARDNSNNNDLINNADMYINIVDSNNNIKSFYNDNDSALENRNNVFEEYFSSLERLYDTAHSNSSQKAQLNAYAIIQSGLDRYSGLLPTTSIDKSRVTKLCDKVNNGLRELKFPTSLEYSTARDRCIQSLNIAMGKIETSYSARVGGR